MKFVKAWYRNSLREGTLDIRYLLLWFMVAVYPLVVVPRLIYIHFSGIVFSLGHYTGPRYILLILLAFVALIVLVKDRTRVNHPVFIPLGLFMTFLLVSTLLAPVPLTAWMGKLARFTGFSTYFCCFILFILAFYSRQAEKLLRYMILSAVIVALLAVLQYFSINLLPFGPSSGGTRGYSTLGQPNFLGTYTAFILPAAIIFFLRFGKLVWLVSAGVIFAGLVVSETRGAWLGFMAGFVIILWYYFRFSAKRQALLQVVMVFALVAGVLLASGNGAISQRATSISGEMAAAVQLEDGAGSNRMFIWKESLKLLPEYWAFGIGPDHLAYAAIISENNTLFDKVHSNFLEIAVTMGVFALLSYLAFLCFFLRPWKDESGLLFFVMIFVYLLQGLFNIDAIMVLPLFWIVLGLSLSGAGFPESSIHNNSLPGKPGKTSAEG